MHNATFNVQSDNSIYILIGGWEEYRSLATKLRPSSNTGQTSADFAMS